MGCGLYLKKKTTTAVLIYRWAPGHFFRNSKHLKIFSLMTLCLSPGPENDVLVQWVSWMLLALRVICRKWLNYDTKKLFWVVWKQSWGKQGTPDCVPALWVATYFCCYVEVWIFFFLTIFWWIYLLGNLTAYLRSSKWIICICKFFLL